MKKLYFNYLSIFKGLSKEVWWLALVTLINRAGTMVIPFLSLYLTNSFDFSLSSVGWIMTAFGFGSLIGAWLGGILTDKLGYYKVMLASLISTGFLFIAIQYLDTFYSICIGIFFVMIVADTFRPAMYVALNAYSKPENKTRSVALIRLAVNLGFSAGPTVGGIIITVIGYSGLFWIDGITCILAGLLLLKTLNPKIAVPQKQVLVENPQSVYKDHVYWVFFLAMFLFGIVFLQYFSTIPIFYKEIHSLSEMEIGLILGLNGFVIFIFEMPLVKYFEKKQKSMIQLIINGAILTALSFVVLNLSSWVGIVIVGILLMTIGEMIAFPFSNVFAMNRSTRGRQGQYMAMYAIAFSLSHIVGPNVGLRLVDTFGFSFTWNITIVLMVLCIGLFYILKFLLNKETQRV